MATAGAIGVIIPPSITFVVYGSISDTSIGDLFIAGVLPGLVMGAALIAVTFWLGRKKELTRLPKASGKERWKAFKDAFWGLLMPVIILGGIYGGVFSPTDAAAVSAVYGLFVGVVIYRTIKFKQFIKLLVDSASTTATVMFITAAATLFAYVLTRGPHRRGHKRRAHRLRRRRQVHLPAHREHRPAHRGLLPRLHLRAVHLHPAVLPRGHGPQHRPGALRRHHDSEPRHRPRDPARRREPLRSPAGIADVSLKKISSSVIPLIIASLVVLLIVTYFEPLSLLLLGGSAA